MLKKCDFLFAAFAAVLSLVVLAVDAGAETQMNPAEPVLVAQASRGGAPNGLPEDREREYHDCRERHNVLVKETGFHDFARGIDRAALDVACRIKFVDVRTGKQHGGCWIQDAWVTKNSNIFQHQGIHKNDSPDCREIFGHPVNFPTGGGVDTVYQVDCGATGRAGARDKNCQCPPDAPRARGYDADGVERCLSDNDVARVEECKEKGWDISEAKGAGDASALICDFAEALRFADGRHNGCVLHGSGDGTDRAGLPSCEEANFDELAAAVAALAARRAQGVPDELPDERVQEYLDCRERGLVVEKKSRANWHDTKADTRTIVNLFDAACLIKHADAVTGEGADGCWIHKSWLPIIGIRRAHFNPHNIYEDTPFCRDLFGDPAEFPDIAKDAVYMFNCEVIDRASARDGSCECPPEAPQARTDGADGEERCVTENSHAQAEACLANGWNVSEVASATGDSAFFCDFPVKFSFAGGRHDSCVLYGPGDRTDRAEAPSCGKTDFDGLALALQARQAGRVPDELPDERVREYLDCRERRELIENRVRGVKFGEGGTREAFYVLDVACRVKFADAATGEEYAGCWIHKDPIYLNASRRAYFPSHGIQADNPNCREVFGHPAEFPADNDAAYLFNCEAAGRPAERGGRGCGCPSERPNEFVFDGKPLCVSGAAHSALESCREANWTIRQPDQDNRDARPTLACLIELD